MDRDAEILAACVEKIATLSPEQGALWLWGEGAESGFASRRAAGTRLSLTAGGRTTEVPIDALRSALRSKLVDALEGEAFWLFRRPPIACIASEGDRTFLEPLEHRLRAFQEALRARVLDDGEESARRMLIYAELEEGGLFDEALLVEKIFWLRTFGFGVLAGAASASLELWSYYRSPERRAIVGRDPPERLIRGALSLDWAGTGIPPGFDRFRWWALAERTLLGFPDLPLARGTMHLSQGSFSAKLLHRSEDGAHLALYDSVW